MLRLNPNQLINRATNALRSMRNVIDALHPDDGKAVWKQVSTSLGFDAPTEPIAASSEDMEQKILKAIHDGLDSADAQMVRAAMGWQEDHAGREYLKELTVNVVPYEVEDKSLDRIIAECDEDRFAEIVRAVEKRRGQ